MELIKGREIFESGSYAIELNKPIGTEEEDKEFREYADKVYEESKECKFKDI